MLQIYDYCFRILMMQNNKRKDTIIKRREKKIQKVEESEYDVKFVGVEVCECLCT